MDFIGEIAALSAALFWSFSSFIFTNVSIRVGAIQLNTDRMLLASILLIITIILFRIDITMSSTQIFWLTLSGFVGLVIGDSFLFRAFKEIGPRIGMLIMSFNPAIAALTAYLILGEILSFWGIIGMAITLTGISLVILEPNKKLNRFPLTISGIIFGFIAAMGQGVGLVFAKLAYEQGDIHIISATLVRIASAIIILLPLASVFGKYKNPFSLYTKEKNLFGSIFLGSIIGPYFGITLSFFAIIYTKIGIASTLMSTVPIMMLPLSVVIYKEKLSFYSITGAIISVVGIALLFLI